MKQRSSNGLSTIVYSDSAISHRLPLPHVPQTKDNFVNNLDNTSMERPPNLKWKTSGYEEVYNCRCA